MLVWCCCGVADAVRCSAVGHPPKVHLYAGGASSWFAPALTKPTAGTSRLPHHQPSLADWPEAQGGGGEARPHGCARADRHPVQVRLALVEVCAQCAMRADGAWVSACGFGPSQLQGCRLPNHPRFQLPRPPILPCPPSTPPSRRLFEKQPRWSFPQLQKDTNQPTQHLKEVLGEIAVKNLRGPYKDLWELKKGEGCLSCRLGTC